MTFPIVIVGEALLDVDVDGDVARICPDTPAPVLDERLRRERPGGAGLAACLARRASDADVILLTALGHDDAGRHLRGLLGERGVHVVDLGDGGTTSQKIRLRGAGQTIVRLDRGSGPDATDPTPPPEAMRALRGAAAVLVADYGLGLLARPGLRTALVDARERIVWDPHPRSGPPVPGVALVTPNESELLGFVATADRTESPETARSLNRIADTARRLGHIWSVGGVAVTRGDAGVLLVRTDDAPIVVPAPDRVEGDPNGAGDAFAAHLAVGLARGLLPVDALEMAVEAAARHVADGLDTWTAVPAGVEPTAIAPPRRPAGNDSVRLVATGGCFDLLHAGHVATLRAARALGDSLVVLLNSDRSVRRLKGPDRPLQPEDDRRAVLLALDCVDDVVIFDEDTPAAVLDRLRPDLFVKGGDYTAIDIAERSVLARWGGEVVTVPYLSGRSTTRLLEEARRDH